MIYLDVSKVFDIVSLDILINTLTKCRLNECTVNWIYLLNGAETLIQRAD